MFEHIQPGRRFQDWKPPKSYKEGRERRKNVELSEPRNKCKRMIFSNKEGFFQYYTYLPFPPEIWTCRAGPGRRRMLPPGDRR